MSQQINLFNPIFLKQKKYFSAVTIAQSLSIIAVGMIAFWGILLFQVQSLEAQRADTAARFKQTQAELLQVTTETGRKTRSKLLEDELVLTESRIRNQEEILKALQGTNLGKPEGFSGYLVALARQTVSGLWLTGFSVSAADNELVIRGRVLRPELLPTYIRMLNREEVLRGRRFAELKMVAREEVSPEPGRAQEPADSTSRPASPQRYVEFSLEAEKTDDRPGLASVAGKTAELLR